jgi:hypothetical protein
VYGDPENNNAGYIVARSLRNLDKEDNKQDFTDGRMILKGHDGKDMLGNSDFRLLKHYQIDKFVDDTQTFHNDENVKQLVASETGVPGSPTASPRLVPVTNRFDYDVNMSDSCKRARPLRPLLPRTCPSVAFSLQVRSCRIRAVRAEGILSLRCDRSYNVV